MPVDVLRVADYLLDLGNQDNAPIDPMKLQKLVYLAHGWHLAFLGVSLVKQEIEAWNYGPVIPVLYKAYKSYKGGQITAKVPCPTEEPCLSADQKGLIKSVWDAYKPLNAIRLSMLTHESGYAWDLTMRQKHGWGSPVIPNELIQDEFLRRLKAGGRAQ